MILTKRLAATVFLLSGLLQSAWAQDDKPKFIYPSKDDQPLQFYDNTEVIVAYECPVDKVTLRIFCRDENKEDYIHQAAIFEGVSCADGEYSFRVDFDYYASRCWFNMRDGEGTRFEGINSPGFSLSRTAADATFGPDQPTSSIATSSIPSSTGLPESSSTGDANDSESTTGEPSNGDSSSDSVLSTGAKAGIGVGVSLGVLGLAALAGAFWMVRRRKGKGGLQSGVDAVEGSPSMQQELPGDSGQYMPPEYKWQQEHYTREGVKGVSEAPPSELADTRTRHELP